MNPAIYDMREQIGLNRVEHVSNGSLGRLEHIAVQAGRDETSPILFARKLDAFREHSDSFGYIGLQNPELPVFLVTDELRLQEGRKSLSDYLLNGGTENAHRTYEPDYAVSLSRYGEGGYNFRALFEFQGIVGRINADIKPFFLDSNIADAVEKEMLRKVVRFFEEHYSSDGRKVFMDMGMMISYFLQLGWTTGLAEISRIEKEDGTQSPSLNLLRAADVYADVRHLAEETPLTSSGWVNYILSKSPPTLLELDSGLRRLADVSVAFERVPKAIHENGRIMPQEGYDSHTLYTNMPS